jgi:tetratricopeptide (TPR) repeat protein
MHVIRKVVLLVVLVTVAAAQSIEPPLSDTRLTVHTLVREDIFAGFLADDMERFSRGEKNIDLLLEKRPEAKADLLAWKGGATLYRAVRAYESNSRDEFQKKYQQALDLFTQAGQLDPDGNGVSVITGGSYVIMGDRLPKENQAAAWSQAYTSFRAVWKQQAPIVDKLPVHIRGELLGGLAQSARRTGRTGEMNEYLDKILEVLRDTPYESAARELKKNPAADAAITCLTCHESGRLSARVSALNNK